MVLFWEVDHIISPNLTAALDEMGLGKSLQSIAFMAALFQLDRFQCQDPKSNHIILTSFDIWSSSFSHACLLATAVERRD